MLLHNVDNFMDFFSHLNLKIIGRLLQLQYDVKKLALLEYMVIVCTLLIEILKNVNLCINFVLCSIEYKMLSY